ncbi:hypothetical protein, variant [Sphaeroforma arctica JP610]|uniref:MYND-type domain-containing protein n=1 Tax=Sphaeroforma arctica JP610 TaxID=667725 RepID=A0A0L0G4R5_9EUKA|nr:hypothetical protein, variant [Sphaeroforma arctica JP610]KNC84030.1 hypothetical protein, variant [Sphaeroforma arctica JP610]|eukprot:XP_014157932.1 hypothetical protein, variant [Sphaeroforma arctica JP610]
MHIDSHIVASMSPETKRVACYVCSKDSDRACPCEMGRRYCSRECQKVDWQERDHKSVCSQTVGAAKTPEKDSDKKVTAEGGDAEKDKTDTDKMEDSKDDSKDTSKDECKDDTKDDAKDESKDDTRATKNENSKDAKDTTSDDKTTETTASSATAVTPSEASKETSGTPNRPPNPAKSPAGTRAESPTSDTDTTKPHPSADSEKDKASAETRNDADADADGERVGEGNKKQATAEKDNAKRVSGQDSANSGVTTTGATAKPVKESSTDRKAVEASTATSESDKDTKSKSSDTPEESGGNVKAKAKASAKEPSTSKDETKVGKTQKERNNTDDTNKRGEKAAVAERKPRKGADTRQKTSKATAGGKGDTGGAAEAPKTGTKRTLHASTNMEKAQSEPRTATADSPPPARFSPPAAKVDTETAPNTKAKNGANGTRDKDYAKGGERVFSIKPSSKANAKPKAATAAPPPIVKDARATKNNAEVRAQANEKMLLDGKRRRRRFEELERNYICEFPNCGRPYASEHSLNQHVRLKHAVRSPDRRRRGFVSSKGRVIGRAPMGRPLSRHVSHQPTSSSGPMLEDPRSMRRHDSRPYGGPSHIGPPPPEFIVTSGDGEQQVVSKEHANKGSDKDTAGEAHAGANSHGKRPLENGALPVVAKDTGSPVQKPKLSVDQQQSGGLKKEIPWTRAQVEGPESGSPPQRHESQGGPPVGLRTRSVHYEQDIPGGGPKDRPPYEHGPPPHGGYYGMPHGADRGEWPPGPPEYNRYPGLPPDARGDPRYAPSATRDSWVEGQGPPPPGAGPPERDYRPYGPPDGYARYGGFPPGYYHDPREYYGAPRAHSPFTSDGRPAYMHGDYPPPPRSGYGGYGMPPSSHSSHAPHGDGYWADRRGYGPPAPRAEPSSYREM